MAFSVKPGDFANARYAGAKTLREASIGLVREYVDQQLKSILALIKAGKRVNSVATIVIHETISRNSEYHTEAIKQIVEELRLAEFQAKYISIEPEDDGPNRSSPGYEGIEIKL